MRMFRCFGVAAILVAAAPVSGFAAVTLEGHFSGRADHSGGVPGEYVVGETYTVYQTLDDVQPNPWYPWLAGREYTAVVSTVVTAYDGASVEQTVSFAPGTVEIWEDDPGAGGTAADYADPTTFTDGLLVLTGTVENMAGTRLSIVPNNVWTINGNVAFHGGAGLASVNPQCGFGNMVMNDFIQFLIPAGGWPDAEGYEESYGAEWKCPEVVTTEEATWGRVKSLYR